MKHLKMLGLAAIAAMAFMAVLGAGSASAVTLCKESIKKCPEAQQYGADTTISAQLKSGTNATLTTSIGNVVCSSSTVSGTTTTSKTGKTNLHGNVTGLTFSGCSLNGESCTVATEHLPYTATVAAGTVGNGSMIGEEAGTNGRPQALVECGLFGGTLKCVFGSKAATFAVTGGNPATATISQELEREGGSGFLCPSTSTWDATYEVTAPKPLFISAEP